MTVVLPTAGIVSATPFYVDAGGLLSGPVGSVDQRLDRLGDRFGCNFQTKPMKGDEARVWIARLIRGRKEKARIKFPQPGATLTSGSTAVYDAAAANAEVAHINSAPANFREGEFLSFVHSGKYYLHQLRANAAAYIDGVHSALTVQPPFRTPLSAADVVYFGEQAVIEGYVINDEQSWDIDQARIYGLGFSIREAE
jgi:hypothetical protein